MIIIVAVLLSVAGANGQYKPDTNWVVTGLTKRAAERDYPPDYYGICYKIPKEAFEAAKIVANYFKWDTSVKIRYVKGNTPIKIGTVVISGLDESFINFMAVRNNGTGKVYYWLYYCTEEIRRTSIRHNEVTYNVYRNYGNRAPLDIFDYMWNEGYLTDEQEVIIDLFESVYTQLLEDNGKQL